MPFMKKTVSGLPSDPKGRAKPCVFLDRDGVLIEDRGYMHKISDLKIFQGVPAALAKLRAAGFLLIGVTNQSGIARGIFPLAALDAFNLELQKQLGTNALDGIYVCPHHPRGSVKGFAINCDCRKPGIGLINQAMNDHAIDLSKSFMIGDKDSDVECARNAKIGAIRISSGQYEQKIQADAVCGSLLEAARFIVKS